jgi:hypothetical protein
MATRNIDLDLTYDRWRDIIFIDAIVNIIDITLDENNVRLSIDPKTILLTEISNSAAHVNAR